MLVRRTYCIIFSQTYLLINGTYIVGFCTLLYSHLLTLNINVKLTYSNINLWIVVLHNNFKKNQPVVAALFFGRRVGWLLMAEVKG